MNKKRIITGVSLIIVTLLILFFVPMNIFSAIVTLLFLYAAWEMSRLLGICQPFLRLGYVAFTLILFFVVQFLPNIVVLWIAGGWWVVAFLWILFSNPSRPDNIVRTLLKYCAGIFALTPCWAALNLLRLHQHGAELILFMLLLIWTADTGAYFVGKRWGKHLLIPAVSPKKTWEGLFGGVVLALCVAIIACLILSIPVAQWGFVLLTALLVALFAVVGDLLESLLKRQVGIKDSGCFLPGHGGLLDRIDSLMAAAPIFLLCGILFRTMM